ncbi:MAG: MDR family MFS transporter [Phycisphaerae bacterium]
MLQRYLSLPRAIHVLCLGAFVNRAGAFLAPFLTLYLREELNLGTEFATRAMGVYGFAAIAAFVAGGHFADQIGRRTVMLISLLGAGGVLLVFGSLTSTWSIIAALFVFAVVAEMYRPAASAMITDLVASERRAEAFGLMYVAINLGFAVATSVGGILARHSFQWLFRGDAATAFIYAVIIFLTIRETLPRRRERKLQRGPVALSDAEDRRTAEQVAPANAVRTILTDKTFVVCWLGSFFLAAMFMQALSTFPLYVKNLGMGSDIYGRIIAINGVMIVFLQLPTTAIVARFHRGTMLTLSAVVMTAGFALTAVATTAWQLALTVVIWTTGEMMNAPLMSAVVSDLAPSRLRGRYMGAYAICFSVAMMIGAPLGGIVLDNPGGTCLWLGSAGAGLMASIAYWCIRNRVTQHASPAPV